MIFHLTIFKFHGFSRHGIFQPFSMFLHICGSTIQCEETVKLLGVTFDYMLNFEAHIANICKKAARQINVLLILSNVLNEETKILI